MKQRGIYFWVFQEGLFMLSNIDMSVCMLLSHFLPLLEQSLEALAFSLLIIIILYSVCIQHSVVTINTNAALCPTTLGLRFHTFIKQGSNPGFWLIRSSLSLFLLACTIIQLSWVWRLFTKDFSSFERLLPPQSQHTVGWSSGVPGLEVGVDGFMESAKDMTTWVSCSMLIVCFFESSLV